MEVTVSLPDEAHTCTILESAVDYVIQAALGVLAFSTLIIKWRLEAQNEDAERRPMRVFLLDTTKQSAGFFVAHVGNMAVASLLAADDVSPCVWYFVNIVFDTTVRVLFAYWMLQLAVWAIRNLNLDPKGLLSFGDYGDLYVLTCTSLKRWGLQLALWVGIVLITVCMKGLLVWAFKPQLAVWGNWIMGPLERHTASHGHGLELVVVMMVIPFILCAVQLWVQDSFLKSKKRGKGLRRFDPASLASTERDLRQVKPEAEPIFLLADALWGPDSYRSRQRQPEQEPAPINLETIELDDHSSTLEFS